MNLKNGKPSRASRILAVSMRHMLRPALSHAPLNERTLRALHLADHAASPLRPLRGTTVERVSFDGFSAELVTARNAHESAAIALHFHGGVFAAGGLRSHRRLVSRIGAEADMAVLNVAYRQLPKATLDQTLEDCLTAYRWAVERGHGGRITLTGDSAGGYLVLALALRIRDEGLPEPTSLVLLSPWIDLDCEHSETHPNAAVDAYMPVNQLRTLGRRAQTDRSRASHPLIAELTGLPPVLIQVGSEELLRSDAELIAERLDAAGVPCHLQIWDGQVHVFQAFADLIPEARAALHDIGAFIRTKESNHA